MPKTLNNECARINYLNRIRRIVQRCWGNRHANVGEVLNILDEQPHNKHFALTLDAFLVGNDHYTRSVSIECVLNDMEGNAFLCFEEDDEDCAGKCPTSNHARVAVDDPDPTDLEDEEEDFDEDFDDALVDSVLDVEDDSELNPDCNDDDEDEEEDIVCVLVCDDCPGTADPDCCLGEGEDLVEAVAKLQSEIGEWSRRNFGQQISKVTYAPLGSLGPVLGIVEELGEYAQAQPYAIEKLEDALADTLVYLCDFCERESFTLSDYWLAAVQHVEDIENTCTESQAGHIFDTLSIAGRLCHVVLKRHQGIRGYDKAEYYTQQRDACVVDVLSCLMWRAGGPRELYRLARKTFDEIVSNRNWLAPQYQEVPLHTVTNKTGTPIKPGDAVYYVNEDVKPIGVAVEETKPDGTVTVKGVKPTIFTGTFYDKEGPTCKYYITAPAAPGGNGERYLRNNGEWHGSCAEGSGENMTYPGWYDTYEDAYQTIQRYADPPTDLPTVQGQKTTLTYTCVDDPVLDKHGCWTINSLDNIAVLSKDGIWSYVAVPYKDFYFVHREDAIAHARKYGDKPNVQNVKVNWTIPIDLLASPSNADLEAQIRTLQLQLHADAAYFAVLSRRRIEAEQRAIDAERKTLDALNLANDRSDRLVTQAEEIAQLTNRIKELEAGIEAEYRKGSEERAYFSRLMDEARQGYFRMVSDRNRWKDAYNHQLGINLAGQVDPTPRRDTVPTPDGTPQLKHGPLSDLWPVSHCVANKTTIEATSPNDMTNPNDSTNPKDLLGQTKPQLHLFPSSALVYGAKVFEQGAQKYGPYNWREKKVRYTVYIAAAQRHIASMLDGEDNADSGLPHAAHAMACMAILLDAFATGNLIDDRPTPGAAAKLIEDFTSDHKGATPQHNPPEGYYCTGSSDRHIAPVNSDEPAVTTMDMVSGAATAKPVNPRNPTPEREGDKHQLEGTVDGYAGEAIYYACCKNGPWIIFQKDCRSNHLDRHGEWCYWTIAEQDSHPTLEAAKEFWNLHVDRPAPQEVPAPAVQDDEEIIVKGKRVYVIPLYADNSAFYIVDGPSANYNQELWRDGEWRDCFEPGSYPTRSAALAFARKVRDEDAAKERAAQYPKDRLTITDPVGWYTCDEYSPYDGYLLSFNKKRYWDGSILRLRKPTAMDAGWPCQNDYRNFRPEVEEPVVNQYPKDELTSADPPGNYSCYWPSLKDYTIRYWDGETLWANKDTSHSRAGELKAKYIRFTPSAPAAAKAA